MASEVQQGRKLLAGILGAHLIAFTWTFFRFADTSSLSAWLVQVLLWTLLPSALCLLACQGRSWARWVLVCFFFLISLGQGFVAAEWTRLTASSGFAWERVLTSAVLAFGYLVAVIVVVRSAAIRVAVATGCRSNAIDDEPDVKPR